MPVFDPNTSSMFSMPTLQQGGPFGGVLADAIAKRLAHSQAEKAAVEAKYAERKTLADVINQEQINQWYGPKAQSEIGLQGAQTGYYGAQSNKLNTMTPLEADELRIKNKSLPQTLQAEINYKNALGLGRSSAGTSDELRFHAAVKDYNPQLTIDQLREAADAYATGKLQLADGTPLAPMNPTLQRAYDRAYKSTTTAPLITQGVKANAAEAEMPVLDKYIKAGREPYGNTIFGKSPQQIADTFAKNDKAAQNRLGDYIASDVLSFDKAALQTRIAGTESGVTIINEVMNKARQTIDATYPQLSDTARQRALEQVGKALTEALAARNKYGIGASSATGKNNSTSGLKPVSEMTTEEIENELAQG